MKITIYSTTTCPYCKMLKDYLGVKGLLFEEKLVDVNDEAQKEMASVSNGFMGVPFVLVQKDDGSKQTILGFDKGKLEEVFS